MGKPGSDPLGAKPVLPPPTGDAAVRASKAFREYVDEAQSALVSRRPPAGPLPEERTQKAGSSALPDPDSFGSGRRYDLALSMVDLGGEGAAVPEPMDPEAVAEAVHAPGSGSVPASLDRPPPGAATVRPPVRRSTPDAVPQELLETAADSAMLSAGPDGTTSFDIAFSDELFDNLACRISFIEGRIVATFRVTDDNTRRLFEGESRALVARLEDRGLRVQEVRVEMA